MAAIPVLFLFSCIETEIIPEVLEPKLVLNAKSAGLISGQTAVLTARYTDEKNEDRSELIEWRSQNLAIASVQNGVVSARLPGQTWIVAFVPGKAADSALITVVADVNAVAQVIVTASQNTLLPGATLAFSAAAQNASGAAIPGKTITWNSSNITVLTINNSGLATAQSPGTAQVTATADGITSLPFTVTVNAPANASRMGAFQGNASYNVSGTATLTAGKLSFSNDFRSSNGPGLRVYLAKNAPGVLTASNSIKLGNLVSTSGAQEYTVPGSVQLSDFDFAVVYCEPFNVAFGFARLN